MSDEIVGNWKQLHQHPELGYQEKWTTAFIRERLAESGIGTQKLELETGIVGLIKGTQGGPCVALRADIDALPIEERNEFAHRSLYPGCMHACGHDSHAAALLGAAKLLEQRKNMFRGWVKLIFQPAEELVAGASTLIAKGVLQNPKVDFIFGQHCASFAETGKAQLSAGFFMAATAHISIVVKGRSGHGAMPDKARDPIVAAAGIITALQSVVSRRIDPLEPAVVSIGRIQGGSADNMIPDFVELEGTARMLDDRKFDQMEEHLRKVIISAAHTYGCEADFVITRQVPGMANPVEFTDWVIGGPLSRVYGRENIFPLSATMGSEDFAYYLQLVPGVFAQFGVREKAQSEVIPWHSSRFSIDEKAIPLAAAAYAQVAFDWLAERA